MNLRPPGATEEQMPPIGLGLAALGRPGYVNLGHASDLGGQYDVAAMQAHTHAMLDMAWSLGIRYFDVARSYGRAEQFLATWLQDRQIAPDMVTVGSKWGYTYTADWQIDAEVHEVKEHSLSVLKRQWQETHSYLENYLRLYQVHSATLSSAILDNRKVLAELARLKSTGVMMGLSLSGHDQAEVLRRALLIEYDGVRLFDCVQATWNLLEPSVGSMLQVAHQSGMIVIVKEALANGRLTPRNSEPTFAERRALLERHAARLATTVDALVLAVVLAQPWADLVLSGAATPEQLQSNMQATMLTCDPTMLAELAAIAEPPEVYWHMRRGLAWN